MGVHAMKIIPETLKNWRKKRGFSQQKLAEEANIDQKTVARIEVGKGGEARGDTVKRIANALRIKPETLGREPDSETTNEAESRKFGLGVFNRRLRLDGEVLISYDLVKEHYGVGMQKLINVAPMLFTLLAEMSLSDRRRRLKEAEDAINTFNQVQPEHIAWRSWEGSYEKSSIAQRDLFARSIDWMEVNEFYYEEERNPFSDFLTQLAKELKPNNDAVEPEEIHFDPDTLLDHVPLFRTYRENLTGGSARAAHALSHGYIRITQIPKELRGKDEDVTSRRVKWLEAKVPDEDWVEYENWMDSLDISFDSDKSSEKGDENV